jgi:hypothetical protein
MLLRDAAALGDLEVVDAELRVPARAQVDARQHAVLLTGGVELGDQVALAVAPLHRPQAVGIGVRLPQPEARFVRRGQQGEARAAGLGRLDPLVGVERGGGEAIDVVDRLDARLRLVVAAVAEGVQFVGDQRAEFGVLPLQLRCGRQRARGRRPGQCAGGGEAGEQHEQDGNAAHGHRE